MRRTPALNCANEHPLDPRRGVDACRPLRRSKGRRRAGLGRTTLADAWTTRSSARLKTNIQPILGALAMVGKLRGVSYDWKASGRNDIGLIAEEVAQVVPVVVSFDSATGQAQGLDYARLTALLIEAVKQQSKQLDALKAENADLKAQALKRAAAAEQENERLIETVEVLKARLEKLERSVGSYVLAAKAE